jgi:DNA (cytosine-5)-methyltransferase 1
MAVGLVDAPPRSRARKRSTFAFDLPSLLGSTWGDPPSDRARALGVAAAEGMRDWRPAEGAPAVGPIQVVDMFAGCGGLSSGFELVGRMTGAYRLAGAAEIDAQSASTFAANLPVAPAIVDLAECARSSRAERELLGHYALDRGCPTVVVGGPPCQGFSAHRKKDGMRTRDSRNQLVTVFAELALRLDPDLIVLENVPEIFARKHWRQYQEFRGMLEGAGYHVRAQIHNLAGFGVPQERFRALVIASRTPVAMPVPFLSADEYRTVRSTIGELPPLEPRAPSNVDLQHVCTKHRPSTVATIKLVPKDGGSRPKGVGPACLDRVDGFRDVYGRLYWDRPANTITAYARNPASGRYVHPDQHRGLSIREAALLQSFPMAFHFDGSFDHKYQQIGNAVPPAFAAFLAAHLLGQLAFPASEDVIATREHDIVKPTSNSFSSSIAGRKKGSK